MRHFHLSSFTSRHLLYDADVNRSFFFPAEDRKKIKQSDFCQINQSWFWRHTGHFDGWEAALGLGGKSNMFLQLIPRTKERTRRRVIALDFQVSPNGDTPGQPNGRVLHFSEDLIFHPIPLSTQDAAIVSSKMCYGGTMHPQLSPPTFSEHLIWHPFHLPQRFAQCFLICTGGKPYSQNWETSGPSNGHAPPPYLSEKPN